MVKHLRPIYDPLATTMGPWRGHAYDKVKCIPGWKDGNWCRCKAKR